MYQAKVPSEVTKIHKLRDKKRSTAICQVLSSKKGEPRVQKS